MTKPSILKIEPELPEGHRWQPDYGLHLDRGVFGHKTLTGYTGLTTARLDAIKLVTEGSAKSVTLFRMSKAKSSETPWPGYRAHDIEIITNA